MTRQKPLTDHQVPITRADHYPRASTMDDADLGDVVHLALDYLGVDIDVVEIGRVTISSGVRDPSSAYGSEYDMTPEAARHLATLLGDAAVRAPGGEVVDLDGERLYPAPEWLRSGPDATMRVVRLPHRVPGRDGDEPSPDIDAEWPLADGG